MGRNRRRSKKRRQTEPSRGELLHKSGLIGQKIGRAGEVRVVKAFRALGPLPWIFGARHATDKEDAEGIDVFVKTDVGEIPIQIKTSVLKDFTALREQYAQRKIPIIHISLYESDDEIREMVVQVIQLIRQEILNKNVGRGQ
ncbi:MAG: hypothetical protein AAB727_00825 [Patescibacteria group bacterium]